MKLWSKEALILGGIYGVLDTPFVLLGFGLVSEILFGLFVIGAFMLFFNKTPKFVSFVINQYPQTAYYLSSFGWIPYFMIAGIFIFVGMAAAIEWTDDIIEKVGKCIEFIGAWGIPISLVVAYIKAKKTIYFK